MAVSDWNFHDSGDFDCSTTTISPISGTTSVRARRTGGSGDDGGNFSNNTAAGGSISHIRALFMRVSGFTGVGDKMGVTLQQFEQTGENASNLTTGKQNWYWCYVTGTGEVRVEYWGDVDMFDPDPVGADPNKQVIASGSSITVTTGVPFSLQYSFSFATRHPQSQVAVGDTGTIHEVRVGTATNFSDLNTDVVLYRVFIPFNVSQFWPSIGLPQSNKYEGCAFFSDNGGAFDVRCDSVQGYRVGQF